MAGTLIVLQKPVVEIATKSPRLVWGWGWGLPLFLRPRAWHGTDEQRTAKVCSQLPHISLLLHLHSQPSVSTPRKGAPITDAMCCSWERDPFTRSKLLTEEFRPGGSS